MIGRNALGVPVARLVPWAVLGLGLLSTLLLYLAIQRASGSRDRALFAQATARLDHEIREAVGRQALVLDATAGAIAANPGMTRAEFRGYYDALRRSESSKTPAALGFSILRPWERREELGADARSRGVESFAPRPEGSRDEAHAVVLIEPLEGRNADAPGFDMHAEKVRREAIDRARTTGGAAMTSRVVLSTDANSSTPSFILYAPVYDARKRLLGMAFCGLRSESLFEGLRDALVTAKVGLRIWSGDPTAENLVFAQGSDRASKRMPISSLRLPEVHQTLRTQYFPLDDFGSPPTVRRWLFPVGVALSLLLFALATTLGKAQQASERRSEEQALLADVGRLTAGTADADNVLREIAAATANALDAICRIDLLEPHGLLRTISTRTEGNEAVAALEREYPRLEHDTLFRKALESGETQRTTAYQAKTPAYQAKIDALNVGPLLVAPLWLGNRSLGALTFARPKGASGFSTDSVALAEAIAGRMALAIDNVRLYRDLERRVDERTRDLEASNHELESFCYSVSHDLRTPLRSLDGFSRALQEDYGERLDDQGIDYIERIRASTRRMDELITALLTLSRLTRREIVPVDVDVTALVRDQMHDLDPEGRIDFSAEDGLNLNADPRMLAVLFDNLLSNAIKFTGRVESPKVAVGRTEDGAIFVRDNGAGFDMAYAAKLFQPFERLHSVREFPGHGIGLATVERIVRRHGGEVRAEGRPSEGAAFFLRFPK